MHACARLDGQTWLITPSSRVSSLLWLNLKFYAPTLCVGFSPSPFAFYGILSGVGARPTVPSDARHA